MEWNDGWTIKRPGISIIINGYDNNERVELFEFCDDRQRRISKETKHRWKSSLVEGHSLV